MPLRIAAGERLYMLEEFSRLLALRSQVDVAQPDLCHCGGLSLGKRIAALAQQQDILLAPHVSVGPVALCAAVHFGWSTPNVLVQDNFRSTTFPGGANWSAARAACSCATAWGTPSAPGEIFGSPGGGGAGDSLT